MSVAGFIHLGKVLAKIILIWNTFSLTTLIISVHIFSFFLCLFSGHVPVYWGDSDSLQQLLLTHWLIHSDLPKQYHISTGNPKYILLCFVQNVNECIQSYMKTYFILYFILNIFKFQIGFPVQIIVESTFQPTAFHFVVCFSAVCNVSSLNYWIPINKSFSLYRCASRWAPEVKWWPLEQTIQCFFLWLLKCRGLLRPASPSTASFLMERLSVTQRASSSTNRTMYFHL